MKPRPQLELSSFALHIWDFIQRSFLLQFFRCVSKLIDLFISYLLIKVIIYRRHQKLVPRSCELSDIFRSMDYCQCFNCRLGRSSDSVLCDGFCSSDGRFENKIVQSISNLLEMHYEICVNWHCATLIQL